MAVRGNREGAEELFGPKVLHVSTAGAWRGRDSSRLRDDATWRRFLRGRLTKEEVGMLGRLFEGSEASLAAARFRGHPAWRWTGAMRDWILDVLEIEVDLRPAGRAILRAPDPPPGSKPHAPYRVEIQWHYDRATRSKRPVSVHVIADEYLHPRGMAPPMDQYLAAFLLRSGRGGLEQFDRMPRRRPKPGVPIDPDFYRRLLASYDRLVGEGYHNPASELARRMDVNHSTLKSWLRRGRLYLEGS